MKKILLLTGVLLALTASLASAAPGLDAGWSVAGVSNSGCPVHSASLTDRSDPCNDNFAGPYAYALAVHAPAGISKWVGEELILDVQTDAAILPDWWHLEKANAGAGIPAGCRDGSYSFSTVRGVGNTSTCKDYWGVNPQSGGTVWLPGNGGPNRTRMFGAFARATSEAIAITPDVEYYVGSGSFDTNHAVADPGPPPVAFCDGCLRPACIVFQYLKVAQPAGTPGGDALITTQNVRRYMTWQGGAVGPGPGGNDCPAATPTRKATWGQVKSLYR
jgi:hypothetical protein